jgi:hypothetical protein
VGDVLSAELKVTIALGKKMPQASGLRRCFGSLEVDRATRHHGRDGVLVDHLGHGIAKQHHILVERLDVALKLDTVDEIDRNRNMLLSEQVQKRVL